MSTRHVPFLAVILTATAAVWPAPARAATLGILTLHRPAAVPGSAIARPPLAGHPDCGDLLDTSATRPSPAAADCAAFEGFAERDGRSTRHGDHTLHAPADARAPLRSPASAQARARQLQRLHDAFALQLAIANAGIEAAPATAPPSSVGLRRRR